MASIFNKRGILYIGYYVTDVYGKKKHIQHSLKMKDTRENRKIAKLVQREKELELMKPHQNILVHTMNLRAAFKIFLKAKKDTAKNTKINYNSSFNYLTKVVADKTLIKDVTSKDLLNVIEYMREIGGLSENSISSYTKDLKTFWNWMIKENLVIKNVVERVKQEAKPIITIPEEDFRIIIHELYKKNLDQYRIIKFLKLTGFRVGEALYLNWEDIDFRQNRILLRNIKMKREDEFPLYLELRNFLNKFKQSNGKIFPYKDSKSLRFWRRLMKKLEMKYTLHNIRKTFATRLVNKNVSVFDAMKLLRHKNVSTTMKYYTYADLQRLGDEANKVFSEDDFIEKDFENKRSSKQLKIVSWVKPHN